MKKYGKTLILTTAITLLPMFVGLAIWSRLPDQIATHFGLNGEPNGWSGKTFTVFGIPLFLGALQLFIAAVTLNDPKKENIHPRLLGKVLWIIPAVSLVVHASIYLYALGVPVDISVLCSFLVGCLFLLLGNYMPKLQQNYTVGIKLPWTLNSEENWSRTHRLAGKLWTGGGVLILISSFLGGTAAFSVIALVAVLCAIIPAAYSFVLYRSSL